MRILLVALFLSCGLQSRPDGGDGGTDMTGGGSAGGGQAGGSAGGSVAGGTGGAGGGTAGGGIAGGGTAGGGTAGGGTAGGGTAGGGTAGGGTAGGGVAPYFDAGTFHGDGGTFTWVELIEPGTNVTAFTHVRAFNAGDVWFTATAPMPFEHLVMYIVDGGAGAPLYFGSAYSDLELTRAPAAIAVADESMIALCDHSDGGCLDGNDWVGVQPATPGDTVRGLCSDGTRFFATGATAAGDGALFTVDTSFARLVTFPGAAGVLLDCWVRPDGVIFATTTGKVAHYAPDGGSSLDDVNISSLPASYVWSNIHGVGYQLFITGTSGHVVELRYDGTMALRYSAPSPLEEISGLFPQERLAAGDLATARYTSTAGWASTGPFFPGVNLHGLTAVTENLYFAVGAEGDAGQILRGQR
jgi:hypothetical protein